MALRFVVSTTLVIANKTIPAIRPRIIWLFLQWRQMKKTIPKQPKCDDEDCKAFGKFMGLILGVDWIFQNFPPRTMLRR